MNARPRTKSDLPPRLQSKAGAGGKVYYYWTPYENGELKWFALGHDHVEAMRKYAELEAQRRGETTISMMLTEYLAWAESELSPRTLRDYALYANTFTQMWGNKPPHTLLTATIAFWLNAHRAPVSANRHVAMLSSAYSWAQRRGLVESNPCYGIRRNRERKRTDLPTQSEIDLILSLPNTDPVRLASELTLITALRKSDLLALRHTMVEEDGLVAYVAKNRKWRKFPLSDELLSVLQRARTADSEHIIHRNDGLPYTESGFNTMRRRRWKQLGFTFTFHDLRARAITNARYLWGRDIAQDIAAHEDGSTTERYVRERAVLVVPAIPLKGHT